MYAITAIGPESWPLNRAKGNQTFRRRPHTAHYFLWHGFVLHLILTANRARSELVLESVQGMEAREVQCNQLDCPDEARGGHVF